MQTSSSLVGWYLCYAWRQELFCDFYQHQLNGPPLIIHEAKQKPHSSSYNEIYENCIGIMAGETKTMLHNVMSL